MKVDSIIKSKWIAPVDSKETLIKDHAIVINEKKLWHYAQTKKQQISSSLRTQ